jgi:ATPase subunit of ABC transporter with duplicated ATPase domains
LRDVSFVLPDGRPLLNGLTESFGNERAALVGRNGAGKTVLSKIMAGLLTPSSGTVTRGGIVFYLDQTITPSKFSTAADLAGVQNVLDAIDRLERGRPLERDVELADGNWDVRERLIRELALAGLGHLTPETPASRLSGGECTRTALVGAFLSGADFLILDEPTNHLDAGNRRALTTYLDAREKGLLVVTHDRALLERMERVVELSPQGLRSYGGNGTLYAERKAGERAAAFDRLERVRADRRRAAVEQQRNVERQQHRSARGRKSFSDKGLPKALRNALRASAEKTAGKLHETGDEKAASLAAEEKEAFTRAEIADPVVLIPPACSVHAAKIVLRLSSLTLPWGSHDAPIDATLTGPERVALVGPNGSGKTTLLRVLRGEIEPRSGACEVRVVFACLDQFVSSNGERSSLELLRAGSGGALSPGEAGTRLAQVGVARERLSLPTRALSGGERLKVELLCAIHRVPSPQLLILDEPTNHLDAESVESVEKMLNAWTGALIVVSHDSLFLDRIGATRRIELHGRSQAAG